MGCLLPKRTLLRWVCSVVALSALTAGCGQRGDDPLEEIRELQAEGRYAESLARLEPLVEAGPGDGGVDLLYGKALLETRRSNAALEPLRRAAAAPEHAVEAGVLLATALLRAGMDAEAVAAADRVLEIEPDHAPAWKVRARANLAMRRPGRALADIERALELAPNRKSYRVSHALVLLSLNRFDEAAVALATAKERLEEERISTQLAASLCVAEARLALGREDTARARSGFASCIEQFPSNPLVVRESVDFYDSIGEQARANEVLRGAIAARPQHALFLRTLVNRLREQGQVAEVERLLERETERAPSVVTWSVYANHHLVEGDYGAAARAYREALAAIRRPGSAAEQDLRFAYADSLIQAGELDAAREQVGQLEDAARADLLLGRILLIEGDARGALEAFDRGIRVWPNNAAARYLAGQAAERVGDFERAAREYQASLRADAGATEAGLMLASLYAAQGKDPPALDTVRRYNRAHSDDPEGFVLGLRVAHRLGRIRPTETIAGRLAALPGQQARAVGERAMLSAADGGPAAAVDAIERSELDLTDLANVFALRVLVEQLAAQESHRRALERVDAALAAHPDEVALLDLRGEVLERAGRADAARTAFERALELDTRDAAALSGLARLAAASGAREKAVDLYDRAAAADPVNTTALFAAALLLLESDRTQEAEQRLDRLLHRDPRHAAAAHALAILLLARGGDLDRALDLARRAVLFDAGPDAPQTLESIRAARGVVGEPAH
jgi:tetratricopeptide (TPR) repeat protein